MDDDVDDVLDDAGCLLIRFQLCIPNTLGQVDLECMSIASLTVSLCHCSACSNCAEHASEKIDASFLPLFALVCITMSLKIIWLLDDGMLVVAVVTQIELCRLH